LAEHPRFGGVMVRGTGELVLVLDVPRLAAALQLRVQRAMQLEVGPEATQELDLVQPEIPAVKRKTRVLYTDDSLSVRKVAEVIFGQLGVDITLAKDGVDALEKLREGPVDIIITDLEMPRMHGYELLRELRLNPAYRNLPVVVVTSRSGQRHQDEAKRSGANAYLTKPFTKQALQNVLEELLGKPS
jgi:chemosensory pili system protein ChpA (sensor histidine kinase/response regulator)